MHHDPKRKVLRPLLVAVTLLVGMLWSVLVAGAASAQTGGCEPYSGSCPTPAPGQPGTGSSDGGSLAFTGGDIAILFVVGVGAVGTGAVIVRRTRPRHPQA